MIYFPSYPALCLPQGTGDVLAELAAQAAASQQQGFSFDGNHTGASAGQAAGRQTGITVSFDRIAPCLLPEQKQVGKWALIQCWWAAVLC